MNNAIITSLDNTLDESWVSRMAYFITKNIVGILICLSNSGNYCFNWIILIFKIMKWIYFFDFLRILPRSPRINVSCDHDQTNLTIHDIQIEDMGEYTLNVQNGYNITRNFKLKVLGTLYVYLFDIYLNFS